ncbi:MAG: polysaccharide biosynthesis/export family protein [Gemmatimonadales bacterium]
MIDSGFSARSAGWRLGGALALVLLAGGEVQAQDAPIDVRRAQATRVELEAALKELDKVIASPGYSKNFRKSREAEAQLVKDRLAEGDFQVGDDIDIAVVGEAALTGKFKVLQGRVLSLPQVPPIGLHGVLRTEVRDHLTTEIGKYVKNPQVTIQGSYIRLAVFGAVGQPGYYTVAADALISEVIMQAGGPSGQVKMEKSSVRRQGQEVIAGTEIQRAIESGQSLDQINLHGGDELLIGTGGRSVMGGNQGGSSFRNWFWPLQAAISISVLLTRIF